MLDYDARFLTFNYTEFLETEYGINPLQINYIHGHRKSGRNSIIVGHGGDDKAFDKWWQSKKYNKPRYSRRGKKYYRRDAAYKIYQSDLPEYNGIAAGLQEYYDESRKPVELILSNNRDYFDDLYDIKVIYVFGFSFNSIDLPYIRAIIRSNDYPDEIEWRVSYYDDDELNKLKLILKDLGVDIEHKVKFFLLSEVQL